MEKAARRELFEETGLIAEKLYKINKIFKAKIWRKDGVKEFIGYTFIALKYSGKVRESKETKPVWVKIRDLNKYSLLPNVKEIVELAIKIYKQIGNAQSI